MSIDRDQLNCIKADVEVLKFLVSLDIAKDFHSRNVDPIAFRDQLMNQLNSLRVATPNAPPEAEQRIRSAMESSLSDILDHISDRVEEIRKESQKT